MKVFFGIFCSVFSINLASAQVSYGIKGGINLSDVVINNVTNSPDAESDFKMKGGVQGGFFAIAEVGTRTALSAELLYSNKGVNAISPINLHYITLPVLVRYSLTEKWIAEGGVELGYLIEATSKYGNVTNTWDNKIDLGLDLGIQYLITPKVSAGMRLSAGVSNINRNAGNNSSGERIRYQNRVLQFSLGYTLWKSKF